MSTPNAESECREILAQGVKLLRTTYACRGDFAHAAQMWVLAAEELLLQIDGSGAGQ